MGEDKTAKPQEGKAEVLRFSCPHCHEKLTVPTNLAGVSGPCPVCGEKITAPLREPTKLPESPKGPRVTEIAKREEPKAFPEFKSVQPLPKSRLPAKRGQRGGSGRRPGLGVKPPETGNEPPAGRPSEAEDLLVERGERPTTRRHKVRQRFSRVLLTVVIFAVIVGLLALIIIRILGILGYDPGLHRP